MDISNAVPIEALTGPAPGTTAVVDASAPAVDQADAEAGDTRSARERLLDEFADVAEAGPLSVQQLMQATGLNRGLIDPVLSRLTKQGVLEHVDKGLYQLAPPKPVPPPPPPPAEQVRLDGTTQAQWLEWLWTWIETGDWHGPGDAPGPEGQGVPVDIWMAFAGEIDAQQKQQAENAALRDRLLRATGGNHVGADALSDVLPLAIMTASGIPLDLIVSVIRSLYAEGGRVLTTWSDLLGPVAQEHHRVLALQMAEKRRNKLSSLDADARKSPAVRRMLATVSMAAQRKRADASGVSTAARMPGSRRDAPVAPASPAVDLGDDLIPPEWGVTPTGRRLDAIRRAGGARELTEALAAICDLRGSPGGHVTPAGSPVLQPTDERRRTGSHYTPRSLTEPIVRHALAPAFDRLGADATPEQILDLKVCDPAMGSAAFLVEACRALAARLVKAWERWPATRPAIPADEDEDLHARRLVAQRCLYGVDKNPLATDLAKLSLWLATLARDHEFTFLDHALKSGDSLVGLTAGQIKAANWDVSKPQLLLFRQVVEQCVGEVMKGRAEIQAAPDDTARAIQEARHSKLESRIGPVRAIGDAVIAAFFAEDKPKARENKRREVESWLLPHGKLEADWDKLAAMAATLKQGDRPLTPFHWEIEFPEVFARENGGFDAIVGNPPFLGGSRISSEIGAQYLQYILSSHVTAGDKTDLVLYFFARSLAVLRNNGIIGLVATNTISQGDSRSTLRMLKSSGLHLFRARRRLPWPGDATVIVSVLHLSKGVDIHPKFIDDCPCDAISVYLKPNTINDDPEALFANVGIAYEGFGPYGAGFILHDGSEELDALRSHGGYDAIIFEYIGGEDVLDSPYGRSNRKIIYIGKMDRSDFEHQYPAAYKLIERTVKGERQKKSKRVVRALARAAAREDHCRALKADAMSPAEASKK